MRHHRALIGCFCVTVSLLLTFAAQSAPAVGANVSGALGQNPALLGFAPVFTAAADVDVALPGVAGLQSLMDEWYDKEAEQLKILLDFSSQEKAEETLAALNKAFSTLQDGQGLAVTGLTLGRLGLGVTASAATHTVDRSSIVSDEGTSSGYAGTLDLTLDGIERADAVLAIGLPITRFLAVGASAKMSRLFAQQMAIEATIEDLADDDEAAPTSIYEVGEGLLFDAGVALNLKYVQIDVALKDIGNVEWKAEKPPWDEDAVVGEPRDHSPLRRFSGGVVLKPFDSLDLSARYDKNLAGNTVVRAEAAFRPVRWLTLKVGQVAVDGERTYYTLGGGLRLWAFGLDAGIAAKDDVIVGGRARLSIGF
ncbi:MAG: hypothetical protein GX162_12125 [Firmicutes bacterium]|nr:hypothetical protein [Bacillota bacterium]